MMRPYRAVGPIPYDIVILSCFAKDLDSFVRTQFILKHHPLNLPFTTPLEGYLLGILVRSVHWRIGSKHRRFLQTYRLLPITPYYVFILSCFAKDLDSFVRTQFILKHHPLNPPFTALLEGYLLGVLVRSVHCGLEASTALI